MSRIPIVVNRNRTYHSLTWGVMRHDDFILVVSVYASGTYISSWCSRSLNNEYFIGVL